MLEDERGSIRRGGGGFIISRIPVDQIDPFHVRENVSKLEDKTKEI